MPRCEIEADIDAEELRNPGHRARVEALTRLAIRRVRLRLLRRALKVSQVEVARRMGVTVGLVQRIEHGDYGRQVADELLNRYEAAIEVSDDEG